MHTLAPVAADVNLSAIDTSSTPGVDDRKTAEKQLEARRDELGMLQERLYADSTTGGTRSVLLVLQAMDTAGKGGIIRHVVGQVDPQGVHLHAFKAPSAEEKQHDFLWRVRRELPTAGRIGVFDRSHYEDVLIARVHGFAPPDVIEERYGLIAQFEQEIVAAGTAIIKVMLHISYQEQKARLEARLDRAEKNWKYNPADVTERGFWPAYMEAYQLALTRTSTPDAPWFVIPADHKWYARWAVQTLLIDTLNGIDPRWPAADYDVAAEKRRLSAT
jgi:PPK2 family polyphosphate:nucleotide phosphotransferase